MRVLFGLRVVLALLFAVMLPLEQAHCALTMAHDSAPTTVQAHQDDGDEHGCCPESTPHPASPADPICCGNLQLPAATVPVELSVDTPTSVPIASAIVPVVVAVGAQGACVRLEPDARSGAPPDPSAAPQSPRSPPESA